MNLLQHITILLVVCSVSTIQAAQSDGVFQATVSKKVLLHYRTITPKNYNPQKKYPLLLFLHGKGEQGDDLDKVQVHGPFNKVAELELPVLIVAPQTPLDEWWDADSLSALVDHLLETLPVDRTRVYLTGLSMGGHGTWMLAAQRPEVFAAIAPVCGFSRSVDPGSLRSMPIWIFHGDEDTVINFRESTRMANALYAVNNNVRLTIYPHVGHDSWTETYNNQKLYDWLLSHRKEVQHSDNNR